MTRSKKPSAPHGQPPAPAKNHSPSHRESRGDRTSPGRGAQGVLLYGLHPVSAAWLNPERRIHRLIATEAGRAALEPVLAQAKARGLQRPGLMPADRNDLDRMLPPGAVHQGVAADVAPLDEIGIEDLCVEADSDPSALVVVLDQVTDPHNVGAILRSAAAFGAAAVVTQDRHAPPESGTVAKSASGALEVVPWVRVVNLARALDELAEADYWRIGLAGEGETTLAEALPAGKVALVLGAEGEGMRHNIAAHCDALARLPISDAIESLNVSNAAAIALYAVATRGA